MMSSPLPLPSPEKLRQLEGKLVTYQNKLNFKMKTYRGVIHESASSELKHAEVMVLRDMVDSLQQEIAKLRVQLEAAT